MQIEASHPYAWPMMAKRINRRLPAFATPWCIQQDAAAILQPAPPRPKLRLGLQFSAIVRSPIKSHQTVNGH